MMGSIEQTRSAVSNLVCLNPLTRLSSIKLNLIKHHLSKTKCFIIFKVFFLFFVFFYSYKVFKFTYFLFSVLFVWSL